MNVKRNIFNMLHLGFCAFLVMQSPGGFAYELPDGDSTAHMQAARETENLQGLSRGISAIAKSANKALVFVSISKTVKGVPMGMVDPFEFFFGPGRGGQPEQAPQQKQEGLGSGFFVDLEKGYIITNNHVVEGADEITLKLANEETYPGIVVGRDENTDVAVVQVKDKNFKRAGLDALMLDNSDNLGVGEFVVALGAPFGLESSLSFGVVSALGRGNLQITKLGNFIQTDAAINPGNSGGPLIGMSGKVVGVNTAIFSRSGGYAGIGFAVPANLARRIANRLINDGKVERGYIGVGLQSLDEELSQSLGLPKGSTGTLVRQVLEDGPAGKAGLEPGDVIVSADGSKIVRDSDLQNTIGLKKPGDRVEITYYRNGKPRTVQVRIEKFPDGEKISSTEGEERESAPDESGLRVENNSSAYQKKFHLESKGGAVIVAVKRNSAAERSGLQAGDLILSVNGTRVRDAAAARSLLDRSGRLLLRIEREGEYFFVPLKR
jgi:serine protease Do